jgi:hypothetical protein
MGFHSNQRHDDRGVEHTTTMAAALPDFQVNISHKRWACVLDPTLALSAHGLPLLTRLGAALEVWVARELWHILDNTHFYLERPDVLVTAEGNGNQADKTQAVVQTLREWERIRMENDPSRQHCYWIGDGPLESFLPEGMEPGILWRYEALTAALDRRLPDQGAALPAACRDTAALAVCLPSAFVLTHLPSSVEKPSSPVICQVLETGGIPCQVVAADDPWQQKESDLLRQMLVQTGLGKWVWSGLRLAVLHLAAPAACAVETPGLEELDYMGYGLDDPETPAVGSAVDYWREARGFWYPL